MITQDEVITTHYVLENLAWVVRQRRRAQNLTSHELAAKLFISPSTLSRLELGQPIALSTITLVLAWLIDDLNPPTEGETHG